MFWYKLINNFSDKFFLNLKVRKIATNTDWGIFMFVAFSKRRKPTTIFFQPILISGPAGLEEFQLEI